MCCVWLLQISRIHEKVYGAHKKATWSVLLTLLIWIVADFVLCYDIIYWSMCTLLYIYAYLLYV